MGGFFLSRNFAESHGHHSPDRRVCLRGVRRCVALARFASQRQSRRLSAQPDETHVPRSGSRAETERPIPGLVAVAPASAAEPVTEMLHGVSVSDPYRWLEEQDSPRTRQWIEEQTRYARGY